MNKLPLETRKDIVRGSISETVESMGKLYDLTLEDISLILIEVVNKIIIKQV